MKLFILSAILLLSVSCGKDNKSGDKVDPALLNNINGVTNIHSPNGLYAEEEYVRQQFIDRSQVLVRQYRTKLNNFFNADIAQAMQAKLRRENIQTSDVILYGERNQYAHSANRNGLVVLYTGPEIPNKSWVNYFVNKDLNLDRNIMHELLLLVGADDRNYQYTDQILQRNIYR